MNWLQGVKRSFLRELLSIVYQPLFIKNKKTGKQRYPLLSLYFYTTPIINNVNYAAAQKIFFCSAQYGGVSRTFNLSCTWLRGIALCYFGTLFDGTIIGRRVYSPVIPGCVYLFSMVFSYNKGYTTLLFLGGVYHVLGIGRIGIQP